MSRRHLKRARRAARIIADDLLTKPPEKNPVLCFPSDQVHYLHGQHRLKAAEKTLAPSERWWTVDLYLDGEPTLHLDTFPVHECSPLVSSSDIRQI